MFKIKYRKKLKQYDILKNGIVILSVSEQEIVNLANEIVHYIVDKDFIISSPNKTAKAKGFGKYHFIKGFIIALWNDIRKGK